MRDDIGEYRRTNPIPRSVSKGIEFKVTVKPHGEAEITYGTFMPEANLAQLSNKLLAGTIESFSINATLEAK